MKTLQKLLLISALLLCSPMAMAQEGDIMGALMEAAAAQENAGNQAQSAADNAAQSEAATAWEEAWEKMMEENGKVVNALDTKYLKCTALMVLYVHAYLKLVNEHKLGDLTMSACDALGMQTLAMASSTTIMYCPEKMAQLHYTQFRPIRDDFYEVLQSMDNETLAIRIGYMLDNIIRRWRRDNSVSEDDVGNEFVLDYLIKFFRPEYILYRTFEIGQKMEALGCEG
ncbi:hypothetical protein [Flagellimonas lutaonensis]|uniref:Uncharacterized protein n=1 Tax=Flagellimonas lutaonensis TaxID=516051 RepID=A0A0D5YTG4_9FLAO|nr:hypothetical protein [Allomuricauda lutaonensis]AKA35158.1 hypothetical protein VC82_1539 [Allomuricauda lutaonensis]